MACCASWGRGPKLYSGAASRQGGGDVVKDEGAVRVMWAVAVRCGGPSDLWDGGVGFRFPALTGPGYFLAGRWPLGEIRRQKTLAWWEHGNRNAAWVSSLRSSIPG